MLPLSFLFSSVRGRFYLICSFANAKYLLPYSYLLACCGDRNLIDAANIAALAALLTFRKPECTLEGEDGQQVIVYPPEVF